MEIESRFFDDALEDIAATYPNAIVTDEHSFGVLKDGDAILSTGYYTNVSKGQCLMRDIPEGTPVIFITKDGARVVWRVGETCPRCGQPYGFAYGSYPVNRVMYREGSYVVRDKWALCRKCLIDSHK